MLISVLMWLFIRITSGSHTPIPYVYNEIRLEDILGNTPLLQRHQRKLRQENTLPVTLDFDDIQDASNVLNFYDKYGISFSKSAFVLKAKYDGGCCGNFAGLPSGTSALTLLKSKYTVMNVESEFLLFCKV